MKLSGALAGRGDERQLVAGARRGAGRIGGVCVADFGQEVSEKCEHLLQGVFHRAVILYPVDGVLALLAVRKRLVALP